MSDLTQYATKLHDLLETELLTRPDQFQQVITETLTVIVSVVMTLAPQAGAELHKLWMEARTCVLLATQQLDIRRAVDSALGDEPTS